MEQTRPVKAEKKVQQVGFDKIDLLPVSTLIPQVLSAAQPALNAATTDLSTEGGRGPTARRLLARDVQLSRVRLRWYQGLLNTTVSNMTNSNGLDKRAKFLAKLVADEHRRMLASLELLTRIDSPAPTIKVQAHQAAVLVEGGS